MEEPFDNRPGVIWYDGEMVPWQDAKLHVLNHALHYASAIFEGIRCYGGSIFELRQHKKTARKTNSKAPNTLAEARPSRHSKA